jgi:hypothetical protein
MQSIRSGLGALIYEFATHSLKRPRGYSKSQ